MKKIIIIGSGGHARVCIDMLEKTDYRIHGLIDDFKKVGDEVYGYKVIGKIEDIKNFPDYYFFIAIGDNYARFKIAYELKGLSLTYINIIDPSAVVGCEIADNTGVAIMPGAVINTGSYIGHHTIVNTSASLDHDNVLSDFASIGPGVHTGGNVHIGRLSHVGIGSTILNAVTIGEQTVVGAGSVVLKFIAANKLAYGVPCLEIKDRKVSDKYL